MGMVRVEGSAGTGDIYWRRHHRTGRFGSRPVATAHRKQALSCCIEIDTRNSAYLRYYWFGWLYPAGEEIGKKFDVRKNKKNVNGKKLWKHNKLETNEKKGAI